MSVSRGLKAQNDSVERSGLLREIARCAAREGLVLVFKLFLYRPLKAARRAPGRRIAQQSAVRQAKRGRICGGA